MNFENLKQNKYVIYRNDKPNLIVNKELLGILFSDAWPLEIDDHHLEGVAKSHGWHIGEDGEVYVSYTGEWNGALLQYNNKYYKTKSKRVVKAISELNNKKASQAYEDEKVLIKIKCKINDIKEISVYNPQKRKEDVKDDSQAELKF